MLLPANAADPASMIGQAMAIYKGIGGKLAGPETLAGAGSIGSAGAKVAGNPSLSK